MHARVSLIMMHFKEEKTGRTFANRVRGRTPSYLLLQNLPFILLLLTSSFTFPISDFSPYYLSNFLFEYCLFCSKFLERGHLERRFSLEVRKAFSA